MSKYDTFPRNTKQAYLKSCAQAEKAADIRAAQMEQAYQEHTPTQNSPELLDAIEDMTYERAAAKLGIVITRRAA